MDVGRNLNAVTLIVSAANGSTTTFDADTLWGGADEHNGKWWHGTAAPNDEVDSRVVNSSVSSNRTTLTLFPAVSSTLSSDTAELWAQEYKPDDIEAFINQAILDATGRIFNPMEDITLFADGKQSRFDIPSDIAMVSRLQYRAKVTSKSIEAADSAWTAGTNVTVSTDEKLKKRGNSNKLVIGSVSAGAVIAYKNITSIDLSPYSHVEWWARASFTTAVADYKLLLDDTAGSGSAIELLSFPLLTADTWRFCRVALAKADDDTAIVSVGVEDDVGDNDNQTLWIDDIRAIDRGTEVWNDLPRHLWSIDRETSDGIINLTDAGRSVVGYNLIKLVGGDNPKLLSSDSDINEIDDWYVVARATELAVESRGHNQEALVWAARAERAAYGFPMLENVRRV